MERPKGELLRARSHGPPVALSADLSGNAHELGGVRGCLTPVAEDESAYAAEAEESTLCWASPGPVL